MSRKSTGTRGQYQTVMPLTRQNIGKDLLKYGQGTTPHQGTKEQQRRAKQLAKQKAKAES